MWLIVEISRALFGALEILFVFSFIFLALLIRRARKYFLYFIFLALLIQRARNTLVLISFSWHHLLWL